MTIALDARRRAQAIASLRRYFTEELDQEIGDLKAALFPGPVTCNGVLTDAQAFLRDRVADLDGAFEPEFPYWR